MRPEIRCEVCDQAIAQYKCPKCRTPYCRIACYKTHTSNAELCESLASKVINPQGHSSSDQHKSNGEDVGGEIDNGADSECIIKLEQLQALKHSSWLQTALVDTEIRQQLTQIHKSANPKKALEIALESPHIADFMYRILDELTASENAQQ
uniref:Uncharacterized protein AlNc14C103G6123 n=1 Tax=Albugo laibachii Nc14 TaxID=890382 RepID=F0WHR6_9STRA|nr:conserved hypothetical protein [Albugo laibachii Nc14]|eukprot:CCA20791.1 conserved hypothetical protein [Albugo laibachii Nc14]